jgi:hypothetical protein
MSLGENKGLDQSLDGMGSPSVFQDGFRFSKNACMPSLASAPLACNAITRPVQLTASSKPSPVLPPEKPAWVWNAHLPKACGCGAKLSLNSSASAEILSSKDVSSGTTSIDPAGRLSALTASAVASLGYPAV